jgi:cytochrome P450
MNATLKEMAIPDLSDPQTFVAGVPHEALAKLREKPGLYWQAARHGTITGGFWAVTRFKDIVEIEKDPALFTSTEGVNFPSTGKRDNPDLMNHILYKDPPDHSRLRRVVAKSFGPRVVANFESWVRQIVTEVLDDCLPKKEFDWIDDVARLVPSRVIAKVMGVPTSDRAKIVDWADAMFRVAMDEDAPAKRAAVYASVWDYTDRLREEKLRNPADDMVTLLAQSHERGELSHQEYRHFSHALIIAGYETTHTLIGQSMRLILEDPEIARSSEEALNVGNATGLVKEFLRYVTPIMNMARTATRDVEMFGEKIRTGDLMQMYFTSANRDSSVFNDPERFDPNRTESASLAFGGGVHRCLGSALAELEGVVLFDELHKRGVKLRLNGQPRRGWSTWINQLTYLPVAVV